MSSTDAADSSIRARAGISALARAPSIPRRNQREISQANAKRLAIVLRRGMKQSEFRSIEALMDAHTLVSLPVLASQRRGPSIETPVCGVVITGGDMMPSPQERELIQDTVRHARERSVPVLALSDAATLALEAAGMVGGVAADHAVLIGDEVRVLSTRREIEDAIKQISRLPQR
ncbi:MAG TPA: hypothetical protein PLK37_07010 [Terricaulis sp.]|nr:hypothetical protein [Terricaulis sp.]